MKRKRLTHICICFILIFYVKLNIYHTWFTIWLKHIHPFKLMLHTNKTSFFIYNNTLYITIPPQIDMYCRLITTEVKPRISQIMFGFQYKIIFTWKDRTLLK